MVTTKKSAAPCICPTCAAFTMAMPNGQGDYCPSCLTTVRHVRGVKLVQPSGMRLDPARG